MRIYATLKNSLAQVTILLSILTNFNIKAPDGLSSYTVPPEIAVWLSTGLSPEQQAVLLEAEKRRFERALAQEQLTEAEIKELEKSGAFQARPTIQDLTNALDIIKKWAWQVLKSQLQLLNLMSARGKELLYLLQKIAKSKELEESKANLQRELELISNEATQHIKNLSEMYEERKALVAEVQDFIRTIPPYPELAQVRDEARNIEESLALTIGSKKIASLMQDMNRIQHEADELSSILF